MAKHVPPIRLPTGDSDRSREEVCNRLLDLLEEQTGFVHKITSAYHPQSNGLDERSNQTLNAQMQKLVNDKQDNWDELLPSILFSYRTSRHDSTRCTPFLLMYGREARLPIDVTRVGGTSSDEVDCTTKVEHMLEFQEKVYDKARSNVEKAQEKQKQTVRCKT